MNKLVTFWYSFWNSLTNFAYYKDLLYSRFTFSLQYLAFLIFLVMTGTVIAASFTVVREVRPLLRALEVNYKQIIQSFPDNYSITIEKGQLSTNRETPVVLGPPFSIEEEGKTQSYNGFIAIDPSSSSEDFEKYRTFFLLNKESILFNGEFLPLPPTLDETITKKTLVNHQERAINTIKFFHDNMPYLVVIFLIPLIGMMTLLELFAYLVLLVVLTFFTWAGVKMLGMPLTFGQLYKLGMHAITPVILFSLVVTFMPMISSKWSFLLYSAWMLGAITSFFQTSRNVRS